MGKETFAAVAKCPTLFYPPEEFETKSGDIKIKHKQAQKDLEMWPMLQRVVFIKYCVLNVVIFLNSASSAAALVFETCHCVHTLTPRGNRESPEYIFKNFEITQYLMTTLYATKVKNDDERKE